MSVSPAEAPGGPPVIVVGAGLAGLACARRLHAAGRSFLVLEGSDGPGGRVRTDVIDGFVCDRGFQVLPCAYPEVRAVLDLGSLDLRPFLPGATVRAAGAWHTLADPRRRPRSALAALTAPVGSLPDKLRVARLALAAARWPADGPAGGADTSTRQWLRSEGLSEQIIATMLGPLLAGVLLDPALSTSSSQARFVWRSLVAGGASAGSAVPAAGMGAVPAQIAAGLPGGSLRYSSPVRSVTGDSVTLAAGTVVPAAAVVVATEGPAAAALLPGVVDDPGGRPVGCVWYATPTPPMPAGSGAPATTAIALDGGPGPVNNLAVMSTVNPSSAPPGQGLVAASIVDPDVIRNRSDEEIDRAARAQMASWWRGGLEGWRVLRVDRIAHAQPAQPPGTFSTEPRRPVRTRVGVYVCGDHRDNASIQGALLSGRRAAEAVLADTVA
ncbi:FAD-dependent oxidoreductase [Acidiferrimicrobium sp. IK]|uniref:NAD(P)/FAD-dependent oxidoreductase n=1 Tax=Acidiferrimicrobium sp. IK TaxID=2871700 RepID=UPI0021CB35CC|nr:NAD(P)/FAD-dependent oxidoreductase [Acidiferrimicrobium sp. IK]MCU4184629.1 FAD-dependent oxidoreductase [Acidiferrimicrobium sp. IK]